MAHPVLETGWTEEQYPYSPSGIVVSPCTGIQAGTDLLILHVNTDVDMNGVVLSNNDPSWTLLLSSGSASYDGYAYTWWKVADGNEGDVTITANGSTGFPVWNAIYCRVSGADIANPLFSPTSHPRTSGVNIITAREYYQPDMMWLGFCFYHGSTNMTWSPDFAAVNQMPQSGCSLSMATANLSSDDGGGLAAQQTVTGNGQASLSHVMMIRSLVPARLSWYANLGEGEWFPTITNRTDGTDMGSGNEGYWTRNGDLVTVIGYVVASQISGDPETDVYFGGLPFTVSSLAAPAIMQPTTGMMMNEVDTNSSGTFAFHQVQPVAIEGTKEYSMVTYFGTNDDTYTNLTYTSKYKNFSTSFAFRVHISYITSDPRGTEPTPRGA